MVRNGKGKRPEGYVAPPPKSLPSCARPLCSLRSAALGSVASLCRPGGDPGCCWPGAACRSLPDPTSPGGRESTAGAAAAGGAKNPRRVPHPRDRISPPPNPNRTVHPSRRVPNLRQKRKKAGTTAAVGGGPGLKRTAADRRLSSPNNRIIEMDRAPGSEEPGAGLCQEGRRKSQTGQNCSNPAASVSKFFLPVSQFRHICGVS